MPPPKDYSMPKLRCETCRFFEPHNFTLVNKQIRAGKCHYHAPTFISRGCGSPFPPVSFTDWCGKWQWIGETENYDAIQLVCELAGTSPEELQSDALFILRNIARAIHWDKYYHRRASILAGSYAKEARERAKPMEE